MDDLKAEVERQKELQRQLTPCVEFWRLAVKPFEKEVHDVVRRMKTDVVEYETYRCDQCSIYRGLQKKVMCVCGRDRSALFPHVEKVASIISAACGTSVQPSATLGMLLSHVDVLRTDAVIGEIQDVLRKEDTRRSNIEWTHEERQNIAFVISVFETKHESLKRIIQKHVDDETGEINLDEMPTADKHSIRQIIIRDDLMKKATVENNKRKRKREKNMQNAERRKERALNGGTSSARLTPIGKSLVSDSFRGRGKTPATDTRF